MYVWLFVIVEHANVGSGTLGMLLDETKSKCFQNIAYYSLLDANMPLRNYGYLV